MVARLQTLAILLDRLADKTGHIIAWLTLAMVFITFAVVVLRKLFETGSIALQESVSYLHAAVFMLAAAYTLKHDGHVRVDIIYQKLFGTRAAPGWTCWGPCCCCSRCACSSVFQPGIRAASWSMQEGSREAGGLDGVFLLKTAIPVMAVLLLLQGCSILLAPAGAACGHPVPGSRGRRPGPGALAMADMFPCCCFSRSAWS